MTCPHTLRADAGPCSQCAGVEVRRVELVDGQTLVAGEPIADRGALSMRDLQRARRGGARTRRGGP